MYVWRQLSDLYDMIDCLVWTTRYAPLDKAANGTEADVLYLAKIRLELWIDKSVDMAEIYRIETSQIPQILTPHPFNTDIHYQSIRKKDFKFE